ncbi:MAG: sulfatase-like hydrolase/transferase [Helicobacter sp.]|uniref:LTA synthase family protein n=1 Tax=Helicobacter sp. TaxID=218 RepID=UPI002A7C76B2|nr:sulfatase-like hydrolase/transferase [Helicobacter sp.]
MKPSTHQTLQGSNTLLVVCGLVCVYMLSFLAMRIVMQVVFVPQAVMQDIWIMHEMGSRLDFRIICMGMAALLLLIYVVQIVSFINIKRSKHNTTKGGGIGHTLIISYIALISFLVCFSAIGNFYYYKTYHTKIDVFIFGLKDDDTLAVLKIMWQDYPVILILLICVLYSFVCVKLSKKLINLTIPILRIRTLILLHIFTLLVVILGIRGSVGTQPLKETTIDTTQNQSLNHLIINPILALHYAYIHYNNAVHFEPVTLSEGITLQQETFPIFFTHKQGVTTPIDSLAFTQSPTPTTQSTQDSHIHSTTHISQTSPHVVAVLMESFALNILALDNAEHFDMLGSFRPYFESGMSKHKGQNDFVFTKFLSGANGTIASLTKLFFDSPTSLISLSTAKNTKLPLTPIDVYKQAGYDVIFITSGNKNWYNLGDYLMTLGADAIYDSSYIAQHYPQSKANAWAFGNADEYAFALATEILLKAKKPTFIMMLTISNHPPFATPKSFKTPEYALDSVMPLFTSKDPQRVRLATEAFTYASDAFGNFVSAIRHNPMLKDNVIIGASGDHLCRDMKQGANIALDHSVPFYLYIPTAIARDLNFNPDTLGSHKDIFPTLYALSLQEYDFLSLGGRNLFDTNAKDTYTFAYNEAVWIDKDGIYPLGLDTGFTYITKNGIITPQESFIIPESKKQFIQNYIKLSWWQINYRIYGENTQK